MTYRSVLCTLRRPRVLRAYPEIALVQTLQGSSLEERIAHLNEVRKSASAEIDTSFYLNLDMLWIYHDSALEGVVYSQQELKAAILDKVVSESTLIPVYDEIRHHHTAIQTVRDFAAKSKRKLTIEIDFIKELFAQLAPEELEGKGPKYRKDMPLHRLYFHEISPPEKISSQVKQLVSWCNDTETHRSTHIVRLAAKTHYTLLQIYPFPKHSGKVARLILNLMLMDAGYPPVIIHATERQRYYEALKHGEDKTAALVPEALVASVESTIAFYERAVG